MTRAWSLAALSLLALACADLPPPAADGTCGNHVIDADEDCDGFPEGQCRPPGVVGACTLACGLQQDGTRLDCPKGARCGVDGTCRAPSGTLFDGASIPADAPVDLLVGDLDGDGRGDVVSVGKSAFQVMYFDDAAALAATRETPTAGFVPTEPILTDLSGDGLLDVVGPVTIGTLLELGGADRSFQPLAYPTFIIPAAQATGIRLVPVHALPDKLGPQLMAVGTASGFTALVTIDEPSQVFALLEGPASDLAGDVVVGNFDEDPATSPCDELALGYRGDDHALSWSTCKLAGGAFTWNIPAPPPRSIKLAGGTLTNGPVVLDVNRDGHLDLVVGAKGCGGSCAVQVAYGVGDGSFHSDPTTIPMAGGDDTFSALPSFDAFPLALGDFDGDGLLDQVTPTSVLVQRPGGAWFLAARNTGAPWTDAVIADLNRDGLPDVLAGSSAATGLDFYNGVGDGTLNHFPVPTSSPVAHLVTGDFDGDLVTDVAVSEVGAAPHADSLSISFGNTVGAPGAPVSMGLVPPIDQIVRTSVAINQVLDGISELFVVTQTPEGNTGISLFGGRSDRVLRSPLALSSGSPVLDTTKPYVATGYAAAPFVAGDASAYLAILAAEAPPSPTAPLPNVHRAWLYRSLGGGVLDVERAGVSRTLQDDLDWDTASILAVDLQGHGTPSLVALATTTGKDAHGVAVVARTEIDPATGPKDPTWRFAFGNATALPAAFRHSLPLAAGPRTGRARVVDVDGDGKADIVAIADAAEKPGDAPTPHVVVVWNLGDGSIGPLVVIPNPRGPDGKPEDAIDFAALELDAAAGADLVVLSSGGLSRAPFAGRAPPDATARIVEIAAQHLVGAGDLDGDGVDDLVTAGDATITVFRGRPGRIRP